MICFIIGKWFKMSKLGFQIINNVVSKTTASLIANNEYIILFSYDTCVLEY